jgi:vesicle coat complex subunit
MDRIDKLVQTLHADLSERPDEQFNAALELGKIRDPHARERIVPELILALGRKHQALTRAHAAEALGDIADIRAIQPLIDALKDPYRLVRSYAARALGKMRDQEILEAIEPLVHQLEIDDFFGARAEAAEALGKLVKFCEEQNYGAPNLLEKAKAAIESDDLVKLKQIDERFQRMVNEMNASIARLSMRSQHLSSEAQELVAHARQELKSRRYI